MTFPANYPAHPFVTVSEAPLRPETFGAKADGITDDSAAFTALANIANSATGRPDILLSEFPYRLTIPIPILRTGWNFAGRSRGSGSRIINAVSSVFSFGAGTAGMKHTFRDVNFTASGGHIFDITNGTFAQNVLERCSLTAQNANFGILNQTDGDHLDNLITACDLTGTPVHTVPLWKAVSTGGGVNENTFQRGRSTYSGNYVFWLEETNAAQYSNSNKFDGWNFEVPNGGCIKGLSANGWTIESCSVYDLSGSTAKDLFSLDKSTGPASRYNAFKRVIRHGGVLGAGLYDIKLGTAPLTRIEQCDVSSGTGYKIDLGSNSAITLVDLGAGVTVDNRGPQVWQSNGTSLGFFGAIPVTKPATPVTLADVIARGQSLGIWS